MKDYYDILGVPRNASQEDIKAAYRILAHQFHPDRNDGNDKRFKQVNEAYRILSGVKTKAEYDTRYDGGFTKQSSPDSESEPKSTSVKRKAWINWVVWIVAAIIVRLIVSDQF